MNVSLPGLPDPNGNPPVASQNTHWKPNVNVELNFGSSVAFMHD